MRLLPRRVRWLFARRPLAYWAATLAVAVGTAVIVEQTTTGATEARRRWGTTGPALVATRPIALGEPIDGSDAEVRAVPLALRPDTTVGAVPADRLLAAGPISAGEIITTARVRRSLVPDGARGVAVAVPDGLPLHPGDTVDVVGAAGVAARAAVVLQAGDRRAVLAVVEADAPAVARADADRSAVVVLSASR